MKNLYERSAIERMSESRKAVYPMCQYSGYSCSCGYTVLNQRDGNVGYKCTQTISIRTRPAMKSE